MFLNATIIYDDRSIGRGREAFTQKTASFVSFSDPGPDPPVQPTRRRHDKDPPAGNYKVEKDESTGQMRGCDPRVRQKQPAGNDPTLLDPTRKILQPLNPTRPDPRDFGTGVGSKPCFFVAFRVTASYWDFVLAKKFLQYFTTDQICVVF